MTTKAKKKYAYLTKAIQLPDGTRKYIRGKDQKELEEKVLKAQILVNAGVDICSEETFGHFAQMWYDIYKKPYLRENSLLSIKNSLNTHILPYFGNYRLRDITAMQVQALKLTVGEWLDIWTRDYLGGVKASTAYLYKKNVELYIAPRLGKIRLETLNAHTVQHFYNELVTPTDGKTNPLSAKTVKNIHGVFHKALQQAVLIGYLRVNPTDACTLPRIIKKEMHPLEEEQVAAFLKEVQGSPHEYLYKIALFTGLREGEVLGLGWEHIDLENGILTVKRQLRKEQKKGGQYYFSPPKNNRTRSISLAPSVVLLFRLQKLEQNSMRMEAGDAWQENGLVFSNQTGGYLSYRTVYDCFKRIVKKIGSPSTRFHDLRHTYAVACIKSGDDIKTVQENLGHATAAFTLDVYGHVTKQMKRDSAQRMEQFIQAVSAG